jgi:hypothetical protein
VALRRLLATLTALLALTACAPAHSPADRPASSRSSGRSSASPTLSVASAPSDSSARSAAALAELATLPPIDRHPVGPAYDRGAFGTAWADTDHNGCNQRDDVLLRDAVAGTVRSGQQGRCDHDVLGGTWVDPYTGRTLTFADLKEPHQAQAIQIDHVVPLSEAWL